MLSTISFTGLADLSQTYVVGCLQCGHVTWTCLGGNTHDEKRFILMKNYYAKPRYSPQYNVPKPLPQPSKPAMYKPPMIKPNYVDLQTDQEKSPKYNSMSSQIQKSGVKTAIAVGVGNMVYNEPIEARQVVMDYASVYISDVYLTRMVSKAMSQYIDDTNQRRMLSEFVSNVGLDYAMQKFASGSARPIQQSAVMFASGQYLGDLAGY